MKRGSWLLLTAALLWGGSYVAQTLAMDHLGPNAFVFCRYLLATVILIPFAARSFRNKGDDRELIRRSLLSGVLSGIPLGFGMIFQQLGLTGTTAGKAAFLTSLYMVFTPLLGLLVGKRVGIKVWAAIVLALFGSYLLCVTEEFSIGKSDLIVLLAAVCIAVQLLILDRFRTGVDSMIQSFVTEGVVTLIAMAIMLMNRETPAFSSIASCILPILYAGIFGGMLADTFQVIGQKEVEPTVCALLMSLESVFGVLFGILFLHESLSVKEMVGCVLILVGVVYSQLQSNKE